MELKHAEIKTLETKTESLIMKWNVESEEERKNEISTQLNELKRQIEEKVLEIDRFSVSSQEKISSQISSGTKKAILPYLDVSTGEISFLDYLQSMDLSQKGINLSSVFFLRIKNKITAIGKKAKKQKEEIFEKIKNKDEGLQSNVSPREIFTNQIKNIISKIEELKIQIEDEINTIGHSSLGIKKTILIKVNGLIGKIKELTEDSKKIATDHVDVSVSHNELSKVKNLKDNIIKNAFLVLSQDLKEMLNLLESEIESIKEGRQQLDLIFYIRRLEEIIDEINRSFSSFEEIKENVERVIKKAKEEKEKLEKLKKLQALEVQINELKNTLANPPQGGLSEIQKGVIQAKINQIEKDLVEIKLSEGYSSQLKHKKEELLEKVEKLKAEKKKKVLASLKNQIDQIWATENSDRPSNSEEELASLQSNIEQIETDLIAMELAVNFDLNQQKYGMLEDIKSLKTYAANKREIIEVRSRLNLRESFARMTELFTNLRDLIRINKSRFRANFTQIFRIYSQLHNDLFFPVSRSLIQEINFVSSTNKFLVNGLIRNLIELFVLDSRAQIALANEMTENIDPNTSIPLERVILIWRETFLAFCNLLTQISQRASFSGRIFNHLLLVKFKFGLFLFYK